MPGAAGLQEDMLSPSPDVGQHSREVLRYHGYDEDAVNALIAGGAVRGVSS
jgi:crotonobetainyl-CoA:carnitine CoA-transferase CaiB-like acyl-CoA transferase